MMTNDDKRTNLRELLTLLPQQWPNVFYRPTTADLAEYHVSAGLLRVFDYALPQDWWNLFHHAHGRAPAGIVWCYDGQSVFGRPYALDMAAQNDLAGGVLTDE